MRTIVETLASKVDVAVRPYLALVIMREALHRGLDSNKPHIFGQFAAALAPAGPDAKVLAVARVLDRIYVEHDEQKLSVYWAGLEKVGVADAVSAALDIAPFYIERLTRVATAALKTPPTALH